MEPAAHKLVTSPRHDKLCQQFSKYYAICIEGQRTFTCESLYVSATATDTARTLSSPVLTTMHCLIALCAYQTEKGHCSLYHFESGIDGVRLSHNTPLINTLRVAAATHAEYEQIVADFEIANDVDYAELE
jgi:hypothetical protein